jgi:hypothetical protein
VRFSAFLMPPVTKGLGEMSPAAALSGKGAKRTAPTPLGLLPARFCRACITYFIEYILYSRITLLHIGALAVTLSHRASGFAHHLRTSPVCSALRTVRYGRPKGVGAASQTERPR